jgi:sugar lactone lactonase YvrE
VLSVGSGTYTSAQTLTISDATPGATIYYSIIGTEPTDGTVQYTGPIQLNEGGTQWLSVYAIETGYEQSNTVTATYNIILTAAPAPTFSPEPGSFAGSQQVTISDSAAGATIYYTTNGSPTNFLSAVYSGPITVSNSETLVAFAIAPGYSASAYSAATFLIDSASTPFIYTIAGNFANGYSGDGGPATAADLNDPSSAVKDSAGNLYISDTYNSVVRKVAAGTGIITTYAGSDTAGYSGDNGRATSAQLNWPAALALDPAGNLFIVDQLYLVYTGQGNSVIRKVAAKTGIITTYAGSTTATISGDGGPATSADISLPGQIATDSSGNLYIAEPGFETIRKVTASNGTITTVAGSGSRGYTGNNGPALSAAFLSPNGVAVDSSGNIYIADSYNNVVREVTSSTGNIATIAGNGYGAGEYIGGFSGDGGPATSAELDYPQAVAVDSSGNVFIADRYNSRIREVYASTGNINTIAGNLSDYGCGSSGDGGPASSGSLCYPSALSVDSSGNVYMVDTSSRIREATAPQTPPANVAATPQFSVEPGTYAETQTVSVTDSTPGAEIYISMDGTTPTPDYPGYNGPIDVTGNMTIGAIAVAPGYLPSAATSAAYTITSPPPTLINTIAGSGVEGFSSQGGPALSAQFSTPNDVAVDASGNLYILDSGNYVVWKVAASTGNISVYAGNGTYGNSGNGGPATSAEFYDPVGIAVDSAGNLYIADQSAYLVRKVDAQSGIISNFAGNGTHVQPPGAGSGGPATEVAIGEPYALAVDTAGDLFISDTLFSEVWMVSAASGNITVVAGNGKSSPLGDGGLATSAAIVSPEALAVDGEGNLYIGTEYDGRVRKVAASTGLISTVAGNGDPYGGTGDGGLATAAEVYPVGLAVDSAGNLYIANEDNAIRRVDATTGIISRLVGNGYAGFNGDGGSASAASLCNPLGIAFDASGDLYIADECNDRIREVTWPVEPKITWATPAAITFGTALSGTQLDAVASAPGTFAYSPAAGTVLPVGVQTLSATFTPTDSSHYDTATASVTLKVNPAPQTITFAAMPAQPALTTYSLTATASSGLPVTFTTTTPTICTISGNTATLLAVGYCAIEASQAGNNDYAVAPSVGRNLQVVHATQTITFPAIASQPALSNFALSASASSDLTVSFSSATPSVCAVSGATASMLAHGTCTIKASQAGNTLYAAAASISQSFTVTYLTQTITFAAMPAQPALTTYTLTATASSGLPVSYTTTTPTICTISGNAATLLAAGYVHIAYAQCVHRLWDLGIAADSRNLHHPGIASRQFCLCCCA